MWISYSKIHLEKKDEVKDTETSKYNVFSLLDHFEEVAIHWNFFMILFFKFPQKLCRMCCKHLSVVIVVTMCCQVESDLWQPFPVFLGTEYTEMAYHFLLPIATWEHAACPGLHSLYASCKWSQSVWPWASCTVPGLPEWKGNGKPLLSNLYLEYSEKRLPWVRIDLTAHNHYY